MIKRSNLILDCTTNKEPREGRLIQSLFDVCTLYKPVKASCLYYPVTSKEGFLSKLSTDTKYNIIHISAHGSPKGIGNGSTWEAKMEEIAEKKTKNLKANLVHVSACVANRKKLADAFNSNYFIAPDTEVDWINSAMFSTLFYKRYIVDGKPLHTAFEFARKRTQTCCDYPVYWYDERKKK
jgi:hypothetical protein